MAPADPNRSFIKDVKRIIIKVISFSLSGGGGRPVFLFLLDLSAAAPCAMLFSLALLCFPRLTLAQIED
jgi:hypothetical protein